MTHPEIWDESYMLLAMCRKLSHVTMNDRNYIALHCLLYRKQIM